MRHPRRLAALVLAAGLVSPAGAAEPDPGPESRLDITSLGPAAAPPAPPLTLFQWAVMTGGSLLLVPQDGHLYPARRREGTVIETQPPRLAVTLYRDEAETTVPLAAVRAPQEVGPEDWVLERRAGDTWRPIAAMHFHGTLFYGQDRPGPFEPLALEEIRFAPRRDRSRP